jgi:hypothetical protein
MMTYVVRVTIPARDPGSAGTPLASPTVGTVIVGTVMIAVDQVRGGARSAGTKASSAAIGFLKRTRDWTDETQTRVRRAVTEADRRGRGEIDGRRGRAADVVDTTVTGTLGWVQVNVVARIVDGFVPYVISDVVPRLIDGALPEIQARVVPVLIDGLADDPRVRDLLVAPSPGMSAQAAEHAAATEVDADADAPADRSD